jgi:hypothetical protein
MLIFKAIDMRIQRSFILLTLTCLLLGSCKKFLDVVPDNVATVDYAFRQRTTAEQYLFTCYSYMPKHGDVSTNPAFMAGDELWFFYPYAISGFTLNVSSWEIARGNQSVTSPLVSYWTGSNGASDLYQGIRDCNIFLENINRVPVMDQYEKDQWSAEVIFLKAYYHWWLLRLYGPIPLVDKNLPITASQEETQVERIPVDSCINYVVHTIDSAITNLPERINNQATQMGRITKAIAMAVKAQVLVTAASPLFNGNTAYPNFKNKAGRPFFNPTADPQKWVKAVNACKEAIDICLGQGLRLNRFNPSVSYNLPADLQTEMDIRTAVTENFNAEVVWGNTNSLASQIQTLAQPRMNAANVTNFSFLGISSVPLNIVNQFYTKNGVPAAEDKTLDFTTRGAQTRVATTADQYRIQPNYSTAAINFDREPRFYADLGFDGSILFGQGNQTIASLNHLEAKQGQYSGWGGTPTNYNITGYWPVKVVNYLNVMPSATTYTVTPYSWPVIRMADLYLLYAESLNEAEGPSTEVYRWIDSVRVRAGIPRVADAWTNYSNNPSAYTNQTGLRQIIHTERTIELAFEGQRFWDQKRWKEAEKNWREPILGWNIAQSDPLKYYQVTTLFNRTFQLRDYFWPVAENDLMVNKNLVQTPGW